MYVRIGSSVVYFPSLAAFEAFMQGAGDKATPAPKKQVQRGKKR